jgi:hypothetical protein
VFTDGTILGLPGGPVHLEIVRLGDARYPAQGLDQLVFYLPDAAAQAPRRAGWLTITRPKGIVVLRYEPTGASITSWSQLVASPRVRW